MKLSELKNFLTENLNGSAFISVDIQPEYENFLRFKVEKFCEFLNNNRDNFTSLTFLYNGADTLGMISKDEYYGWLIENGCEEETLENAKFYDKGYAFFSYCMDNQVDDRVVANFVRFMYDNDINDSRRMNREMWAKYLRQYRRTDRKEVYQLLKVSDECVFIPDLMNFLTRYSGRIVLTGGGINECLKEVEIAMMALNKKYEIYKPFTY
jgi:hypothetical protein